MIEGTGEGRAVWLVCDDCHASREFSSFEKAVAFKRKQKLVPGGWRVSRDPSGEYRDHCPDCSLKWALDQGAGR